MSNHSVDCDFCGKDMRGLCGVKGCDTQEQANECVHYKLEMSSISDEQLNEVAAWINTFRWAGKVERTHTIPTHQRYNVAEHVYNVLMIAIELCELIEIDSANVVRAILIHDVEELYIGDMPADVKLDKKLNKIITLIEQKWVAENVPSHHTDITLTDLEYHIVKIADTLELAYFCIDEINFGNRNVPLFKMISNIFIIMNSKMIAIEHEYIEIQNYVELVLNELRKAATTNNQLTLDV